MAIHMMRTLPLSTLLVLTVTSSLALVTLRHISFSVGIATFDPYVITANEIVCVLYSAIISALIFPPLADFDLRRERAQKLAVSRYLTGFILVSLLAAFASFQVNQAFFTAAGSAAVRPESELIIHNSILVYGVGTIATSVLGSSRGIPLSLLIWTVGVSPLFFMYPVSLWPFDSFNDAGPWCSTPHIVFGTLIFFAGGLLQWRTAGAGSAALANRR